MPRDLTCVWPPALLRNHLLVLTFKGFFSVTNTQCSCLIRKSLVCLNLEILTLCNAGYKLKFKRHRDLLCLCFYISPSVLDF